MNSALLTRQTNVQRAVLDELLPGHTDRAVFVGQTGSGKTTLAEVLLRSRPWVVVLDIKGTLGWDGYRLVRRILHLPARPQDAPRVIYRPVPAELRSSSVLDALAWWVYERGNTTLYVDELYGYLEPFGGSVPAGLHACLTRGRERGVEVWCSTQRPFRIPLSVLSESEHVYVFRLRVREDRRRIEEVTGLEEERIAKLPKHHFYYCPQDGDPVGPLTLKLPRR
jgi:CheY-like chemotaxis protein